MRVEELATTLPKVLSVYGLAFFSFWPAMPAGLALGLDPILVVCTTTLSYVSGVLLMLLFGRGVRAWWQRRFGGKVAAGAPGGPLDRLWRRYGMVGLGLLAPMTIGAQTGAILGLVLNARPRHVLLWMSLGALGWSVLITLAVSLGLLGLLGAQPPL